jgi:hypothetical protein
MDSIFVNGTVGVGKSTLANALSAAETESHAVIYLDAIRRLSPAPSVNGHYFLPTGGQLIGPLVASKTAR